MTPNHVQPLHYVKSDKIKEKYIKDVKFNQMNELIVSGKGDGTKHELNIIDRLVIASQADGTLQYCRDNYSHWIIQLKRGRKIGRLLKLFEEGNIDYTEIKAKTGFRRFSYNMPVNATKLLSTYFSLNFDYNCAREFINEISMWDGSITPNYLYYSSTVKENSDFVSAVATLAGYSSRLRVQHDSRKDSYKSMYRVYMYDVNYVSCASIQKTMHEEYYNGYVYCVKVPSHKIIVRADGFTFITGNCHMLSNAAWNAMLKLIEEPPAKTIFIFATTDPQKIPKTILGRVQRYDFKRISQEAIENRLVHVLKEEDRLSGNNSTWDAESIEFIAKMANGQMRDALTMLDKCLSYSNYVTIENVVKALGTVNYDIMFKLTNRIFDGNAKEVIKLIGEIYMSGSDLKQFVKDYMLFILDINKYGILEAINYTNIPATQDYMEELESYGNAEFKICKHLLDTLIKLNTDIKWDSAPKGIIEATLLLECKESI
jgi:DNA polymerase-3 subunit gamma/tau